MDSEKIGKFIYQLRTKKNITQSELAKNINVTNKAVSRWERGVGLPDISLLEPLSKELDISILELLNGELIDKSQQANKGDINVLLEILTQINKKYKINRLIIYSLLILMMFIFLTIIYFSFRFNEFDNSYLLQIRKNISLIPLSNLFAAIQNQDFIFWCKNIIINLILSLLVSVYILQFTKKPNKYITAILLLNLIMEIVKWLLLIGIFDINDCIIRIIFGIIVAKIYKRFIKGGDKYNESIF